MNFDQRANRLTGSNRTGDRPVLSPVEGLVAQVFRREGRQRNVL
jgi:hypothetical protein